jgi:tRNA(Ile2) C34 agmatinyltransferase TiaS
MSATLTNPGRPVVRPAAAAHARPRRLTLEQRLETAWEALRSTGQADCPVCRAPMQRAGDGSGRCGGCGSRLA